MGAHRQGVRRIGGLKAMTVNKAINAPAEAVGWQGELDELAERKRIAQQMGGKERIERQHAGGRLTVRERIDKALDPGSFHELGSIAGKARYDKDGKIVDFMPGNGVFGRGKDRWPSCHNLWRRLHRPRRVGGCIDQGEVSAA